MRTIRYIILSMFLLWGIVVSHSQESGTAIVISHNYRMDSVRVNDIPENVKTEPLEHIYVKTNGVGWMMGVTNIAAEIDLTEHWSAALPLYWSGWNYFKSTLKFRTVTIQPEVRYWLLSENNNGVFVGAHLGLGWYNYALDGDYRIQDHGGHSPAFGAGIGAGYRMPVGCNKRWRVEFSLGIGAYSVHYDKFDNHRNGLLAESKRRAWFGIDQLAASVVYTFDLGRKGGAR